MVLILMFAAVGIDFDQFILGYSTAYILIALAALLYIGLLKAFPDSLRFEEDEKAEEEAALGVPCMPGGSRVAVSSRSGCVFPIERI